MRRALVLVVLLVIVGGGTVAYLRYRGTNDETFDAGGRYDSTRLDDMGVIYVNRSDIYAFNEGYSESENCPWGFPHNGIDYFFKNKSTVIAAAPGLVESVTVTDNGPDTANRFHIMVRIRFNATVEVIYNFEPWTDDPAEKDRQLEMIQIEAGDWVAKGDTIATFLNCGYGAHIHFGVVQDDQWRCPKEYLSDEAYDELMALVHTYHPDWNLCYP